MFSLSAASHFIFLLYTKPYCWNEKEKEGPENYFIMQYEHKYDAQDSNCTSHIKAFLFAKKGLCVQVAYPPLDAQDKLQDVSYTTTFILSLAKQDLFNPSRQKPQPRRPELTHVTSCPFLLLPLPFPGSSKSEAA